MVFPQANKCFDNEDWESAEYDNQTTRDGAVMKLMEQIVLRAVSERQPSYEADLKAGEFEFGTAYPAGTYVDTVLCDGS